MNETQFLRSIQLTWIALRGLKQMTAQGVPSALLRPLHHEVGEQLDALVFVFVIIGGELSQRTLLGASAILTSMQEIHDMIGRILSPADVALTSNEVLEA